jgi:hypothetical protein
MEVPVPSEACAHERKLRTSKSGRCYKIVDDARSSAQWWAAARTETQE